MKPQADSTDDVLKGKFVRRVFGDISKDIDQAQRKVMSDRGFENNDWYADRSFAVSENELVYIHLKKHRFVDMRTRSISGNKMRKKSHPIHNKILWGHYNSIIKELHFGFTNAVRDELRKMEV